MASEPDLTAPALPWLADYLAADGMPAGQLVHPHTLGPLLGRRWPEADPAVAATLWWYSTSSTFMLVPVAQMLTTGRAFDMRTSALTVHLDDAGVPDSVASSAWIDDPASLGSALAQLCETFIDTVGTLGVVHRPSLWAIASDSLANRALDVGTALGRIGDATDLARELSAGMPTPRFVDIDADGTSSVAGSEEPADGTRRFLRRSSCCLVFEVGDHKCSSCPRQTPQTRITRLAALVG
ncbi:Fe-S oxidoreductase [Rhodococcoides trifolii]|uniref:Fe-S oxidoreductase n=1 Tax=Rhodococcoides trifolii TaxID=908250 RepID=A0A917D1Q3_9NOCA|nr:(2Fe-2S)-binding protein [Rhodococcus trifolii]GGG08788.1 Fe-S oxidoreductase [Rhodococcus trifolii]